MDGNTRLTRTGLEQMIQRKMFERQVHFGRGVSVTGFARQGYSGTVGRIKLRQVEAPKRDPSLKLPDEAVHRSWLFA